MICGRVTANIFQCHCLSQSCHKLGHLGNRKPSALISVLMGAVEMAKVMKYCLVIGAILLLQDIIIKRCAFFVRFQSQLQ